MIEPFLNDRHLPLGDRVWAVGIPLVLSFALAIAIRTAIQVRFQYPSAVLVAELEGPRSLAARRVAHLVETLAQQHLSRLVEEEQAAVVVVLGKTRPRVD